MQTYKKNCTSSYSKTIATPATRWIDCKRQRTALCTPDCYGRKSSALNAPSEGSSNFRPTHACSGEYCAGKSFSSSWYTSTTCWWRAKWSATRSRQYITTILFPNQGLRGGSILSRMPHHAGSRRGNAENRPTSLRADHGFEVQRRGDQHHAGSSGSKTPVQGRWLPDRGGDGRNACHLLPGGGSGPHVMTRPDVAYAAHQLGKFNDNLGPVHWRTAKRALQYLWRTKDVGITYGGTPG